MNYSRLIALACLALTAELAHADSCKPDCGRIIDIEQYTKEGTGSGVGAVAGGVAGAVLGNQVGTGNTRTVATVGGAAGGAYLGNMAEKKVKTKLSFPRNFVFQEMGYNAPVNWKEKRS